MINISQPLLSTTNLNSLGLEESNVITGSVKHLDGEHEVFTFVRVRDEQSLGRGVMASLQVELLHLLIRLTDPDKGTSLEILMVQGCGMG